jgi:hypothetical protein
MICLLKKCILVIYLILVVLKIKLKKTIEDMRKYCLLKIILINNLRAQFRIWTDAQLNTIYTNKFLSFLYLRYWITVLCNILHELMYYCWFAPSIRYYCIDRMFSKPMKKKRTLFFRCWYIVLFWENMRKHQII